MTEPEFLEKIKTKKNAYSSYSSFLKRHNMGESVDSVIEFSRSNGFRFRVNYDTNIASLSLIMAGVEVTVVDLSYSVLEEIMRVLAFCSLDVAEDLISGQDFNITNGKMYYVYSDKPVQWVALGMN